LLNELVELHSEKISFSLVYIREAHAQDAWPISSGRFNLNRGPVLVNTPNSTAERVMLADRLVHDFDIPDKVTTFVDCVDSGDQFLKRFAPWPIRVFLLECLPDQPPRVAKMFDPQNATLPLREILSSLPT